MAPGKLRAGKSHYTYFDFQNTFHSRDVYCTLVLLFARLSFRQHLFGFREFKKQTPMAAATSTMVV